MNSPMARALALPTPKTHLADAQPPNLRMLRIQNHMDQIAAAKQGQFANSAPSAPAPGGPPPLPVAGPGGARLSNAGISPLQSLLAAHAAGGPPPIAIHPAAVPHPLLFQHHAFGPRPSRRP